MAEKQKVSDLTLEQFHLGELSPSQERRVREELDRDDDLRNRLAAIVQSDEEIRAAYPAERIVPLIRQRAYPQPRPGRDDRRPGSRRLPTLAWAVPVAAVALVLLALPLMLRPSSETRLKGAGPHLTVFRKTPAGAEELRAGSLARQGDVLQLTYVAAGARYGVIFSVDGRGALTWHLPAASNGGSAPALNTRGAEPLANAYELDDAPGFERFLFVFSSSPFPVAEVQAAASRLAGQKKADAALVLPRGLGEFSFLVTKPG
jgi:hypothetical protein